jgi:hypothetical protein
VAQAKHAQKSVLTGQPLQEMIMAQAIDVRGKTPELALQEMRRRQLLDAADRNGRLGGTALQDLM